MEYGVITRKEFKPTELEAKFYSKAEISPVGQEVAVQQSGSTLFSKQAWTWEIPILIEI